MTEHDRRLGGRRVAVLRAGTARGAMVEALEGIGATVSVLTVADVADRPDDEVAGNVGDLGRYRWVAVTSAHAARRLARWAGAWPASLRVAAVGPATAEAVAAAGCTCDVTSPEGTAADLVGRLDAGPVLFLAASSARDDLVDGLVARGLEVTTVVAYDVVPRALDGVALAALRDADLLVAMAPVALDALDACTDEVRQVAIARPLVTIGPTTTARARALGWAVAQESAGRGPEAVVTAVLAADRGGRGAPEG